MTCSDMRHPAWESFRERDRRLAAEEIERFVAAQAERRAILAGRRILPAVAAARTAARVPA